eukprot:5142749-Amphidinium_carterae.1
MVCHFEAQRFNTFATSDTFSDITIRNMRQASSVCAKPVASTDMRHLVESAPAFPLDSVPCEETTRKVVQYREYFKDVCFGVPRLAGHDWFRFIVAIQQP